MCFLECLLTSVKFRVILSIISKVSVEGILNVIHEKAKVEYIFYQRPNKLIFQYVQVFT